MRQRNFYLAACLVASSMFANNTLAADRIEGDYWGFETGEAVENPGAGYNSAGWWLNTANFTVVGDKAHTGERSIKVDATASGTAFFQSNATKEESKIIEGDGAVWLETPKQYVVDFWIYLESGTLANNLLFITPGADQGGEGAWINAQANIAGTKQGEWVRCTSGVIGNVETALKSILRVSYTSTAEAVFYIDDIVVRDVNDVPPITEAERDAYYGFELGNAPGQGAPKNIAGWWFQNDDTYSLSSEQKHSGEYSLLYNNTDAVATGRRFISSIATHPSSPYVMEESQFVATMWVYKESAEIGNLSVQIQNKDGHTFAQADFDYTAMPQGEWTKMTSRPFQNNQVAIKQALNKPTFQINYPTGAPAAKFYIDDIKVEAVTPSSIGDIKAEKSLVMCAGREVTVVGAAQKVARVFLVTGSLVEHIKLESDHATFTMNAPGIYILAIEGEAPQKITVK